MENWHKELLTAAGAWRRARRVVALTGAGVSVASGIPDFRSPGGLWTRFDADRVATAEALRRNPEGVWEFLLAVLELLDRAAPNPAHLALARLESMGRLSAIITQNIDGLHQAAGSRRVVEFHGGCRRFYCMECGRERSRSEAAALTRADIPWRCGCGGLMRPDVVFFGEPIPEDAGRAAEALLAEADLAVVVGTSGEVAPASYLPLTVKSRGGTVIEISPGRTRFEGIADIRLDGRAEDVLPALAEKLGM